MSTDATSPAGVDAPPPVRLYVVLDEGPVRVRLEREHHGFDGLYDGLQLGVYTALRTFDHNRFLDLMQHLRRLRASMVRFGMSEELDTQRLCRALHELCTAYPAQDMRVRIDVLAAHESARGINARELIALAPLRAPDPDCYRHGVAVATTRSLQRSDPLTKTADFAQQRMAVLGNVPGVEDCLLVNDQGLVLEGGSSNFYAVIDGVLRTAGEGVLEGITRSIVLELAHRSGIPTQLEAVRLGQLSTLGEAAISSSSRGLMPVTRIDGEAVGDARVGPVISALHQAYEEHLSRSVRPAIDRRQRGGGNR